MLHNKKNMFFFASNYLLTVKKKNAYRNTLTLKDKIVSSNGKLESANR